MQKQIYLLEDKRKNAVATSQQLKYVLKEREREREREREKMAWKTFTVHYNGCLERNC